jgi:ankyrin repeat protein
MGKLLLAHGADPLVPGANGVTPLMLAAGPTGFFTESEQANYEAFQLVKLVYELGSNDVNALDSTGATALHAAARRGAMPIIQFLVEQGGRLDIDTPFGWNALDAGRGYRDYLGVGRRQMARAKLQADVGLFIENLMKQQGLPIDRFSQAKP